MPVDPRRGGPRSGRPTIVVADRHQPAGDLAHDAAHMQVFAGAPAGGKTQGRAVRIAASASDADVDGRHITGRIAGSRGKVGRPFVSGSVGSILAARQLEDPAPVAPT